MHYRILICCLIAPLTAGAFTPTDIADCALWLEADPATVTTDATGAVSLWTDRSGNGNDAAQPAAASQPQFVPIGINGRPALRFDGTNDFFTIAHAPELNAHNGLTAFFVYNRSDGFRLMQKGDGTGAEPNGRSWFISPAPVMGVAGTWNAGVPYHSGWGVMEALFDAQVGTFGRIQTFTNGTITPVVTDLVRAYVGGTDDLILGKRNNPGATEGHLLGDVAEVIIYHTRLSAAERQQIGEYLADKYGIETAYSYIPPDPYVGPAGVSNCVLWLVAGADQIVTDADGRVSQWLDKTGRRNHATQPQAGAQPLFVTNAAGGQPAIRFDGSNDFFTVAHNEDLDGLRGLTVFAVYKQAGSPTESFRLLQKGTGSGNQAGDWFLSPQMSLGVAGTWLAAAPTTNLTVGQSVYDPSTLDQGAMWAYIDGTRSGNGAYLAQPFTGSTADLFVGKRDNPGGTEGLFNGDLAELLVFDKPLSEAEQKAVGIYLADRYGLAPAYADFQAEPFGPPWISQVAFSPAATNIYLGSPAIHILPNGDYLVSYDFFGNGAPKNANGMFHTSTLAWSTDDGASWQGHTQGTGFFWSSFFSHANTLYRMGASARFESIAIATSSDGGHTWSAPVTLVSGGNGTTAPNYTCGPVPVAFANGRIYRAMENMTPLVWAAGMRALVMSAPVDSDLLNPASWTKSNELPFDTGWLAGVNGIHTPSLYGYLEGNVVVAPDGSVKIILASNRRSSYDKAVILDVSPDGTNVSFNRYIDLPGGGSKFTIRRDPVTGLYLVLGNRITDQAYVDQRNILSLSASSNLVDWELVADLVVDNQPISWEESVTKNGFQYADWQLQGDDLIYLVRTAYFGAANYHDSNRITFHRLPNYATLLREKFPDVPPAAENPGAAFWTLDERAVGQTAPTSPQSILDLHPDNHNLHLTASAAFPVVAGAPAYGGGRALEFNANGGLFISDPASANAFDYGPNDSFTIEIVCRVPNGSVQTGALVAKDADPLSPSWWLRLEEGKARFLLADTGAESNLSSSVNINYGAWHHIAAVRDASNPADKRLRLYIDSQPAGDFADATTQSLANASDLRVGRFNIGTHLFDGAIDLVRITPGVLTPAQFVGPHTQLDADEDLIPDAYERTRAGSLSVLGTGDTDGNGVPDSVEYALGSDPLDPASAPVMTIQPGAGRIEVMFYHRDPPPWLTLQLEHSTDLVEWNPAGGTSAQFPLESELIRSTHTVLYPEGTPDQSFFRARVKVQP